MGKSSELNEEHAIGKWMEGYLCDVESLGKLYPRVIWKAQLINNELGY